MSKTYNIFISHSWSYSSAYGELKQLLYNRAYCSYIDYAVQEDDPVHSLDNSAYFSYIDYSIPENDPVHTSTDAQLHEAIYNKMRQCHVVLIMAGVYSY